VRVFIVFLLRIPIVIFSAAILVLGIGYPIQKIAQYGWVVGGLKGLAIAPVIGVALGIMAFLWVYTVALANPERDINDSLRFQKKIQKFIYVVFLLAIAANGLLLFLGIEPLFKIPLRRIHSGEP